MYNLDPKEKQHGRVYMMMFGCVSERVYVCVCACYRSRVGVCAMDVRVAFSGVVACARYMPAGNVLSAGIYGKYSIKQHQSIDRLLVYVYVCDYMHSRFG